MNNNLTSNNSEATKAITKLHSTQSTNEKNAQEECTMEMNNPLQNGTQIIDTTRKAVTGITEEMSQKATAFLDAYKSKAGATKSKMVEGSYSRGEIKLDDALTRLTQIQEADTAETVSLLNAHTSACKEQGNTGLKIGAGIFAGATGLSIFAFTMHKIFGKKSA